MSQIALLGALEIGLVYGLVALGVFLSFRVLSFPDLTVDGSFPLGAAVAASAIVGGIDPYLATGCAIVAGALAGLVTAVLNVRFRILHLLASILTMIALFSINLRIMGRPEHRAARPSRPCSARSRAWALPARCSSRCSSARSCSRSPPCSRASSRATTASACARPAPIRAWRAPRASRPARTICVGMALSNAMVALAGALFAQTNGFADVTIGTGTIVVGLAAVIVGETILPARRIGIAIVACVLGSILYRLAIAAALNADVLGLEASDLNLVTAVLVGLALILPGARNPLKALAAASRPGMIEVHGLGVTFARGSVLETRALTDVDLAIPAGQFVTVIGSNGAGKTTLLNALTGDVRPDRGRIVVDGQDVTAWPAPARARLIARVFQDPLAGSCEALSIEENLALAAARGRARGLRPALDRDAARAPARAARPPRPRPRAAALPTAWACSRAASARRSAC